MGIIKSLAAPRTWPIERKRYVFVVRPNPGKNMELSLPMRIIIKMIGIASTRKEVRFILNNQEVYVNNRRVKDDKFSVGLMDIIKIPKLEQAYRLLINKKNKLYLSPCKDDINILPLKVLGKRLLKKSKWQLNLFNGYNILVDESKAKNISTNDTVVIELKKELKNSKNRKNTNLSNISEVIKFSLGNYAYVIAGKNVGKTGKIIEISDDIVKLDTNGSKISVPKRAIYIIGKDKPIINLMSD